MSNDGFQHQVVPSEAKTLRISAALLLSGQLGFIVITQFHAGGQANDHPAIFATYAGDSLWKAVHALQFLATSVMTAGLIIFAGTLARRTGSDWLARISTSFSVVSLALYGGLQAIDGIGNKQVDLAWATASASDKPARFAAAESMRWLEWGLSSYYSYAFGVALLALAGALCTTSFGSPGLALVVALAGLAYIGRGWVAGLDGFTTPHSVLIIVTWLLNVVWMGWLATDLLRRRR